MIARATTPVAATVTGRNDAKQRLCTSRKIGMYAAATSVRTSDVNAVSTVQAMLDAHSVRSVM